MKYNKGRPLESVFKDFDAVVRAHKAVKGSMDDIEVVINLLMIMLEYYSKGPKTDSWKPN